jgi:hypothetical protein
MKTDNPRGRVMKFIDAGISEIPVRDVNANYKSDSAKEPYIEYGWENDLNDEVIVGAENYCSKCYQGAVSNVVKDDYEYLFLASYPNDSSVSAEENIIIGYIKNEDHEWRAEDQVAVIGEIKIFPFTDGYPLSDLNYKPTKRSLGPSGRNLTESQTRKVLDHFEECEDATKECLNKVLELENKSSDLDPDHC